MSRTSAAPTSMNPVAAGQQASATAPDRILNPHREQQMKMIKALVKKFKKDEELANHAWVLHVI
ncbi:hypothetical protein [Streptomyces sp. NPDC047976]|uniref:hypothetical protein n=1 Tax=unclassified Streptomyces TaxID=2593676 RepID=UPI0034201263